MSLLLYYVDELVYVMGGFKLKKKKRKYLVIKKLYSNKKLYSQMCL